MMSERQIKERISRLKADLKVFEEVLNNTEKNIIGRPIGSYKYSDEQSNFLRENKEMSMKVLIEMFNEKFGTDLPHDSRVLYNFMARSGITNQRSKKEYVARSPAAIDKSLKTKEKKMLKDLKMEDS